MFPGEPGFQQVSDDVFSVNFEAFPYIERLFESSKALDLSSLELDISEELPGALNAPELLADETIRKYLQLSQTFFIVVDTDNLFTSKIALRNSRYPGMFIAYQEPDCPLIIGYGKLGEYWKTSEDGQWLLTVEDSYYRNYMFRGTPAKELQNVSGNLLPFNSYFDSKGYLLQIGTNK